MLRGTLGFGLFLALGLGWVIETWPVSSMHRKPTGLGDIAFIDPTAMMAAAPQELPVEHYVGH